MLSLLLEAFFLPFPPFSLHVSHPGSIGEAPFVWRLRIDRLRPLFTGKAVAQTIKPVGQRFCTDTGVGRLVLNPTNNSRFALQLSIFTQIPPFKDIFRSKIPSNV